MKHFRRGFAALLALAVLLTLAAAQAQPAYDYYNSTYDYSGLIGAMEVVNCQSWTSLRMYPDSASTRLLKVPVGEVVTNCYYQDARYTYCEYQGVGGYILSSSLAFIYGPPGYEYTENEYLGNMQIVNCQSYASLRNYPSTSATLLARVPLGSIVTNVFDQDARFCYCMYGDIEGYILKDNLSWISGGTGQLAYGQNWIGDAWIVNCTWASLRAKPSTSSQRLAKLPKGTQVTNCYYVDDRFACCTWGDLTGYILVDNLGW